MKRTTIYLPDELKARIESEAHRRGSTEAAVIRAALEDHLLEKEPPRPRLPLFDSGDPLLAERVDEALEGFGL